MKSPIVGRALLTIAFFAAGSMATGANAGVFRAYLSSTGNDANACSLTAPCRLLPAALAAVVDGGEITLLDSANYNSGQVTITKSVTIAANAGISASVAGIAGFDAIYVNTAGVNVTIRNLSILSFNGGYIGVEFAQGAGLHVENCQISNMVHAGIEAYAPGSRVTVKNTVLRNDGFYGLNAAGQLHATLDAVHVEGNSTGIIADGGGTFVTVSNSTITGNGTAGFVRSSAGAFNSLVIRNSVLDGNSVTFSVDSLSGTATAVSGANLIINSQEGFVFGGGAGTKFIYTDSNNTVANITNLVVGGGSLTPLPGI